MTQEQFWAIIDEIRGTGKTDIEVREKKLRKRLRKLSASDLASFCVRFNTCLDQAYDWRLWGAAYLMQGGCSDDAFWDFRSCLISMGREVFEKAVQNPDSLADLPKVEVSNLYGEGFQYVAPELYENMTGEEPDRVPTYPEDPTGEPWEEDDLPKLFPRLFAKYGDDL